MGIFARLVGRLGMSLPALRPELHLYEGPRGRSGEPSWSLHDPVRNLYFHIDWPTFEILCRWSIGKADEIADSVSRETALQIASDSVEGVLKFLHQSELLVRRQREDSKHFADAVRQRRQQWWMVLLHRYLFFRVPLWKPDAFLGRSLYAVRWLGSPLFRWLTCCALMLGLIQTSRQWDQFTTTLVDLFSLTGLLAYGVTLVSIKVIHEFGHAYVAKHYGCRVPTMGMAFLVLFPMAYTDVNDVWRLASMRKRLHVGAAGIFTELSIAAWSTLIWTLLPDGPLRTAAFLLATTTWISTLIINASPFLRFDGYFLLMDWLEIPNLHQRAFRLAVWRLRELLFGLDHSRPDALPQKQYRFLVAFAVATWCYRVVVFSGIAILVYLMFPKPLGPILAWIEIYWFVLKPIFSEIANWWSMRDEIMKKFRTLVTAALLGGVAVGVIFPWDERIYAPAMLQSGTTHAVTLRDPGQLISVMVSSGDSVEAGQLIAQLASPDLEFELQAANKKLERIVWQVQSAALNETAREQLQILQAERSRSQAEVAALEARIDALNIRSPIQGIIDWADPDLAAGDWLSSRDSLATVRAINVPDILAYVNEKDLTRIEAGNTTALFFAESDGVSAITARVVNIDLDAARALPTPILSSTYGGEILTRTQGNSEVPEEAVYAVRLVPEQGTLDNLPDMRGNVTLYGEARSWVEPYWLAAWAVIRREGGF